MVTVSHDQACENAIAWARREEAAFDAVTAQIADLKLTDWADVPRDLRIAHMRAETRCLRAARVVDALLAA